MKKAKKIVYYDDLLHDDFAGTDGFKSKPLPKDFKFFPKSKLYWFFSNFVYYIIAIPVFWVVGRLVYKGRRRGFSPRQEARSHPTPTERPPAMQSYSSMRIRPA